jgi:hypothetical protein
MHSPLPSCPKCAAEPPGSVYNRGDFVSCGRCGASIQIEVFPAVFRRAAPGRQPDAVLLEGESGCFYHPQKKAVVPCQACGRFLCALCDCALHGEHLCPGCLEAGRKKGKIARLQDQRTLYDNLALALAILPLLVFYFTIVTAPMSIYIALRYWNAPSSLLRRTKIRFVLAILLSSLQLAGWAVAIYLLVAHVISPV